MLLFGLMMRIVGIVAMGPGSPSESDSSTERLMTMLRGIMAEQSKYKGRRRQDIPGTQQLGR